MKNMRDLLRTLDIIASDTKLLLAYLIHGTKTIYISELTFYGPIIIGFKKE